MKGIWFSSTPRRYKFTLTTKNKTVFEDTLFRFVKNEWSTCVLCRIYHHIINAFEFSNRTLRHKFKYYSDHLDTLCGTPLLCSLELINTTVKWPFCGTVSGSTWHGFTKRLYVHFKGRQRTCRSPVLQRVVAGGDHLPSGDPYAHLSCLFHKNFVPPVETRIDNCRLYIVYKDRCYMYLCAMTVSTLLLSSYFATIVVRAFSNIIFADQHC